MPRQGSQAAPSTASFLVDRGGPVRVSFFGGLTLGRVGEPALAGDIGLRVASVLDLSAQKVRVVQVRAESKDYLDIAEILEHGITLARALGAAVALCPSFSPISTLKALSYFDDGDLPRLPIAVRQRLIAAASSVRDPDFVPAIAAIVS